MEAILDVFVDLPALARGAIVLLGGCAVAVVGITVAWRVLEMAVGFIDRIVRGDD